MKAWRRTACALMALGAAQALGCDVFGRCSCISDGQAVPRVTLGTQGGPTTVKATLPNQCEIDLDFGTLDADQSSTAIVQVDNAGADTLDVMPVSPRLDPAFSLPDFFTEPQRVGPGDVLEFTVSFSPSVVGPMSSSFQIPTDALNDLCPEPPDGGRDSALIVRLTGAGG
jgi:hypothetical protein